MTLEWEVEQTSLHSFTINGLGEAIHNRHLRLLDSNQAPILKQSDQFLSFIYTN